MQGISEKILGSVLEEVGTVLEERRLNLKEKRLNLLLSVV